MAAMASWSGDEVFLFLSNRQRPLYLKCYSFPLATIGVPGYHRLLWLRQRLFGINQRRCITPDGSEFVFTHIWVAWGGQ